MDEDKDPITMPRIHGWRSHNDTGRRAPLTPERIEYFTQGHENKRSRMSKLKDLFLAYAGGTAILVSYALYTKSCSNSPEEIKNENDTELFIGPPAPPKFDSPI